MAGNEEEGEKEEEEEKESRSLGDDFFLFHRAAWFVDTCSSTFSRIFFKEVLALFRTGNLDIFSTRPLLLAVSRPGALAPVFGGIFGIILHILNLKEALFPHGHTPHHTTQSQSQT